MPSRPRCKPSTTGTGGRAPLWERDHCGRDADEAFVEVTLLAGDEQLVLSCRLDQDGEVTERREQRITGSAAEEVDLTATTWHSALAGHRPVFGYATVERQVQLASNLQEFLEPLLAFGGCFEALKSAVRDARAGSADALVRWRAALVSTQSAVADVDSQRTRADDTDLPALAWPGADDDPDDWLAAHELTETAGVPEVTEQHHERLDTAADRVTDALDDLESAETSLHARLAGPLRALHERAAVLAAAGEICPVCATGGVPWLARLGVSVSDLVASDTADRAFRTRLGALRDAIDTDLRHVVDVLDQDWCDPAMASASVPATRRCATLREVLHRDGEQSTPQVRAAVREACESLTSDDWRTAVLEAVRQSDHRRQWLRARRSAVDAFIDCWRACRADASVAPSWESAVGCLRDLHNQLRQQRAESLHHLTDHGVQGLLQEVGLSVTSLSVQGTKATVEVTDGSGKQVRLSMLSAGQRNALLLAPLLAVAHGGPFGFLVLDDPVHAFDQVRVDRLARLIHKLAARRRVVVLTHDERLKEHLLAQSTACEARSVTRDAATGVVSHEVTASMWKILVLDARDALHVAESQPGGVGVEPTDLVRGLCRMAVDNALRLFVVQQAMQAGRDPGPDLEALDAAYMTKTRIGAVKKLHPTNAAIPAAERHVARHLDAWNKAAHGNPPESDADITEVEAAEQACAALVGNP